MSDYTHTQRIRQDMPATLAHLYLNTGTFGPLPTCVIQAMQEHLHTEWQEGRVGADAFATIATTYDNARHSLARLLHADVQEIALTDNTGEGLNIMSYGITWQAGDEVITSNHEHISALAPLYQLRDRYGIVIRIADLGPAGDMPAAEVIAPLITSRTRLTVLSHVLWSTGTTVDISQVSILARSSNIPLLVDGAQSAGAIPVDVKELGIDFYAIPMQKWLCGPDGTGALYVRRESQHYVTPTYVGYYSMKHEEGITWELQEHAQRFELGGRQTAAVAGQAAVLNWMEETVGYEWLFQHISSLHAYTYSALGAVPGLTLLTPKPVASGLISFTLDNHAVDEVVRQLRDQHNIYIRSIPSINALRISTGFYNTEEEIDTMVQALRAL